MQVFCDNYLDGGYHVPYAHKGLASGLKLQSYSTTVCSAVPPLFYRINNQSDWENYFIYRMGLFEDWLIAD